MAKGVPFKAPIEWDAFRQKLYTETRFSRKEVDALMVDILKVTNVDGGPLQTFIVTCINDGWDIFMMVQALTLMQTGKVIAVYANDPDA